MAGQPYEVEFFAGVRLADAARIATEQQARRFAARFIKHSKTGEPCTYVRLVVYGSRQARACCRAIVQAGFYVWRPKPLKNLSEHVPY